MHCENNLGVESWLAGVQATAAQPADMTPHEFIGELQASGTTAQQFISQLSYAEGTKESIGVSEISFLLYEYRTVLQLARALLSSVPENWPLSLPTHNAATSQQAAVPSTQAVAQKKDDPPTQAVVKRMADEYKSSFCKRDNVRTMSGAIVPHYGKLRDDKFPLYFCSPQVERLLSDLRTASSLKVIPQLTVSAQLIDSMIAKYTRKQAVTHFQLLLTCFLESVHAPMKCITALNKLGVTVSPESLKTCIATATAATKSLRDTFKEIPPTDTDRVTSVGMIIDNCEYTFRKKYVTVGCSTEMCHTVNEAEFIIEVPRTPIYRDSLESIWNLSVDALKGWAGSQGFSNSDDQTNFTVPLWNITSSWIYQGNCITRGDGALPQKRRTLFHVLSPLVKGDVICDGIETVYDGNLGREDNVFAILMVIKERFIDTGLTKIFPVGGDDQPVGLLWKLKHKYPELYANTRTVRVLYACATRSARVAHA